MDGKGAQNANRRDGEREEGPGEQMPLVLDSQGLVGSKGLLGRLGAWGFSGAAGHQQALKT